jgi:hypothetical protein
MTKSPKSQGLEKLNDAMFRPLTSEELLVAFGGVASAGFTLIGRTSAGGEITNDYNEDP